MSNLNLVILLGRVTEKPDIRNTTSGMAVINLRIAVNSVYKGKDGEKKDDCLFVDVTVWGKTAEACAEYLDKGSEVLVEGRLKMEQWEKDGQKRSKIGVVATGVQFIGRRKAQQEEAQDDAPPPPRRASAPAPRDESVNQDEDRLPF